MIKHVCMNCEELRETTVDIRDVPLDHTSVIVLNVEVLICNTCQSVVGMPPHSAEKMQASLHDFKSKRPSIDTLLNKVREETKLSWCSAQMCACAGAANCTGKLSENAYTKRDWIIWKDTYVKEYDDSNWLITINFKGVSPIIMHVILAKFLNISPNQSRSIISDNSKLNVGFDNYKVNEVALALHILKRKVELKGAELTYMESNDNIIDGIGFIVGKN